MIPVYEYEGGTKPTFVGAVGFHVERTGIEEAGRTSHTGSGYVQSIQRSLVVRGRLFTVSGAGVGLNDIRNLELKSFANFPAPPPPPPGPGPETSPPAPGR